MNKQDKLEFRRIEKFSVDCGDEAFRFLDRLSRENGWSSSYSTRCMNEYRKFIFLAPKSKKAVTPSDHVDQVWHLHLCYTRSYWNDLCDKTLGQLIHHGPTKGGHAERKKYWAQYQQTLDLYQEVFGEKAPSDIWPDVETHFRKVDRFVRLNRDDFLIIRKPKGSLFAGLSIPLIAAACDESNTGTNGLIVAGLIVSILAIYILFRSASKGNKDKNKNKKSDSVWEPGDASVGGSDNDANDGSVEGTDAACGGCGGCGGG